MEKHLLKIITHLDEKIQVSYDVKELVEKIYEEIFSQNNSTAALELPLEKSECSSKESYTEDELITVKEACMELNISRWKLTDMRNKKQLTSVVKDGRVRLIRAEVEAAKLWYSLPKGKI